MHGTGIKHYVMPSFCSGGGGLGTARGITAENSGVSTHWRRIVFSLTPLAL